MKEYIKLNRRKVYRGDVYNAIEGERIKVLPNVFNSEYMNGVHDGLKKAQQLIAELEDAESVPVVRCKDCRWHEDEEPGMVFCPRVTDSWVSNDFYCASGRRKDGAKPRDCINVTPAERS